jgi:hypothetical protein
MRECPRCHFLDPPNWRHPAHYPDLDYCRYDEFLEIQPELARKLVPDSEVEDELYVYRRSKQTRTKKGDRGGKYVYRVWKPIFNAWGDQGWSHFRKTKIYDSKGRFNKEAWQKLLSITNKNASFRRSRALEPFLVGYEAQSKTQPSQP